MRIAIVANSSWNISNFRLGLIKHLIGLGHYVLVIAPEDDTTTKFTQSSEIQFTSLPMLRRSGTNPITDLRLMLELRKQYKLHQIDVALQYTIKPNIYGSLAAAGTTTKTISNVTGLGYVFLNKSFKNSVIRRLFKFALGKCDIIVFQNEQDRNELIAKKLVRKQQTRLIHGSGVDINFFKPQNACTNEQEFVFLFIGRLLYDKGIEELIQAFTMLCEDFTHVRLQLIGSLDMGNPSAVSEGKLRTWLLDNPQVEYLGLSNNLPKVIAPTNCVVLPSYREGLPKSILEAMSMAKPVIVSDAPGCKPLIDNDKNGYLCEVRSVQSLYVAMKRMVRLSEAQRQEMGNYGRHLVETKYSEAIVVRSYERLLNELK